MKMLVDDYGNLSIHDLTRRSTALIQLAVIGRLLSIHDLTRRSTIGRNTLDNYRLLSIHDLTRRSTRYVRKPLE